MSTLTVTFAGPKCECEQLHDNLNIEMSWDEYEQYSDSGYIARADCPHLDRTAITVLFENDRFLVYQDKE